MGHDVIFKHGKPPVLVPKKEGKKEKEDNVPAAMAVSPMHPLHAAAPARSMVVMGSTIFKRFKVTGGGKLKFKGPRAKWHKRSQSTRKKLKHTRIVNSRLAGTYRKVLTMKSPERHRLAEGREETPLHVKLKQWNLYKKKIREENPDHDVIFKYGKPDVLVP